MNTRYGIIQLDPNRKKETISCFGLSNHRHGEGSVDMAGSFFISFLKNPFFTFLAGLALGGVLASVLLVVSNSKKISRLMQQIDALQAANRAASWESEATLSPASAWANAEEDKTVPPTAAQWPDDQEKTVNPYGEQQTGWGNDPDATVNPYSAQQTGWGNDPDATVNPYSAQQTGWANDPDATVNPYSAQQTGWSEDLDVTVNPYAAPSRTETPKEAMSVYPYAAAAWKEEDEEETVNPYAATWQTSLHMGVKVETPQITYNRDLVCKEHLDAGGEDDALDLDVDNTRECRVVFMRKGKNLFAIGKPGAEEAQAVTYNGNALGETLVQVNIGDVFAFEGIRVTIESIR